MVTMLRLAWGEDAVGEEEGEGVDVGEDVGQGVDEEEDGARRAGEGAAAESGAARTRLTAGRAWKRPQD